ncbi:MAG: bifunctional 2-C-methyl-D-erythritol 4-phosphate cytidylyltransferase/2-C-methyl-D-erythritol 2,4-cyclodiphosphate synthase, partial [Rhodobacteraceae bacterium]|nr:bifunctional 2-C-methyl-D-erythritol 4-phosphate cytidylyltransferase/2-C-methyl-D-erythritol 2,4-cyclodiphosphate synthase [Paracoccaceae bacterium]
MSLAVLIVAAGRGTRAGGEIPKQWQPLAGKRVIDHTLALFQSLPEVAHVCVVLHPDDMSLLPDAILKA